MISSLAIARPLAQPGRRRERRRIATCCDAGGISKLVASEVRKTTDPHR